MCFFVVGGRAVFASLRRIWSGGHTHLSVIRVSLVLDEVQVTGEGGHISLAIGDPARVCLPCFAAGAAEARVFFEIGRTGALVCKELACACGLVLVHLDYVVMHTLLLLFVGGAWAFLNRWMLLFQCLGRESTVWVLSVVNHFEVVSPKHSLSSLLRELAVHAVR